MAMTRVDVTFTEQRLRVQLNLQQVQGSVQVDRVEPQSAAHGRVTAGATLVAVNGTPIRPLMGRQAWVDFCQQVRETPRPMTLTFEQPAPAGTVAVPPAAAPAATASTPAPRPPAGPRRRRAGAAARRRPRVDHRGGGRGAGPRVRAAKDAQGEEARARATSAARASTRAGAAAGTAPAPAAPVAPPPRRHLRRRRHHRPSAAAAGTAPLRRRAGDGRRAARDPALQAARRCRPGARPRGPERHAAGLVAAVGPAPRPGAGRVSCTLLRVGAARRSGVSLAGVLEEGRVAHDGARGGRPRPRLDRARARARARAPSRRPRRRRRRRSGAGPSPTSPTTTTPPPPAAAPEYKGVTETRPGSFQAKIYDKGPHHLGMFPTALAAARAYDREARLRDKEPNRKGRLRLLRAGDRRRGRRRARRRARVRRVRGRGAFGVREFGGGAGGRLALRAVRRAGGEAAEGAVAARRARAGRDAAGAVAAARARAAPAPASDSSSDDDDINALRAKAAKPPAKKKRSDPLADLLADEKPKKKKKSRQRSDESTPSFDDVGGMALGRSTNGYASLGAVRSAFAAGRYGAQNTEFLQRFDAWLQREALPERVAEFSAQAHAAAEAWRQGRDYLLARDLCSDAAAADLRRVAALGDGAAGAEFLLAFAHYNALDAS